MPSFVAAASASSSLPRATAKGPRQKLGSIPLHTRQRFGVGPRKPHAIRAVCSSVTACVRLLGHSACLTIWSHPVTGVSVARKRVWDKKRRMARRLKVRLRMCSWACAIVTKAHSIQQQQRVLCSLSSPPALVMDPSPRLRVATEAWPLASSMDHLLLFSAKDFASDWSCRSAFLSWLQQQQQQLQLLQLFCSSLRSFAYWPFLRAPLLSALQISMAPSMALISASRSIHGVCSWVSGINSLMLQLQQQLLQPHRYLPRSFAFWPSLSALFLSALQTSMAHPMALVSTPPLIHGVCTWMSGINSLMLQLQQQQMCDNSVSTDLGKAFASCVSANFFSNIWSLSNKRRNALVHALNGNTPPRLVACPEGHCPVVYLSGSKHVRDRDLYRCSICRSDANKLHGFFTQKPPQSIRLLSERNANWVRSDTTARLSSSRCSSSLMPSIPLTLCPRP